MIQREQLENIVKFTSEQDLSGLLEVFQDFDACLKINLDTDNAILRSNMIKYICTLDEFKISILFQEVDNYFKKLNEHSSFLNHIGILRGEDLLAEGYDMDAYDEELVVELFGKFQEG